MNLIKMAEQLDEPWGSFIKKHDRAERANYKDFDQEDWKPLKLRSHQFCIKCKQLIQKGERGYKVSMDGYGGFIAGGEYGICMKMTTSYYIHEKCKEDQ